jgi:hypothetical protein
VKYKYRLIRCFSGSSAMYDTYAIVEMTEQEAYSANRDSIFP